MASLFKLISSLAAACVAAGPATAAPEARAADLLQTAQVTAERLTSCPATADDLVGDATLRILQRHPEAFRETEGWHGYVRQSIRNAFRDELRRGRWARRTSDLLGDDSLGFEDSLPSLAPEDESEELVVEEFRAGLAPAERDVLDQLMLGHCERQIAGALDRTRHDVRTSLQRIRHAAEVTFRLDEG